MAISSNPTKTQKIEFAFRRENRKRFRVFNLDMKRLVNTYQGQLFSNDKLKINAGEFTLTEDGLTYLQNALRGQAYRDIIGVTSPANANSAVTLAQTDEWQAKYINTSYARGVSTATQQQRAGGLNTGLTMSELRDLYQVSTDERAAELLVDTNTFHGESARAIQQASLSAYVQATETMLAQMYREIAAAKAATNVKTVDLIQSLTKRISVANSSGETIASTETIQAFQNGQITSATIASEETGEPINLRWLTRNDSKVRHLHARWHGEIMTPIEASQNIQESPWNCRCGFAQVPPRADTEKRQEMFDKERKELLDAEKGK